VLGRFGEIGRVVATEPGDGNSETIGLVVRGGVSEALVYHVPQERLLRVSPERETVYADVDVADFLARLDKGGTVELRLS
jgi:hypothetical protein